MEIFIMLRISHYQMNFCPCFRRNSFCDSRINLNKSFFNINKTSVRCIDFKNIWEYVEKREHAYEINIPQLASGTRKDFVFEIQIPYIYSKIQDQERVVKVLEARLKLKDPLSGEIIQKSAALNLTLFNENENVGVIEENIDVYSQYMRVKGTQAIDDAKRACEQNNFEDAQRLLDDMTILLIYFIYQSKSIFNNTNIEKQQSCLRMCWNHIGFKLSKGSYQKHIIQFLWFQVVVLNSCQQQYIRRYEFRIFA